MSNYYYLVASLPTVEFGMSPPCSTKEFLQRCQGQLSSSDLATIEKILLSDEGHAHLDNHILKHWAEFNHNFRNEMAYVRAVERGKDPSLYLRGSRASDSFYAAVVTEASQSPDPLTCEKVFDQNRWQYLDELSRFHYFDMEWMIVYALKLKILERYEAIASPQGQAIFNEYKNIEIAFH